MAVVSKPTPIGPWGKATAGATGAVLANALVYPLDMYVPIFGTLGEVNLLGTIY